MTKPVPYKLPKVTVISRYYHPPDEPQPVIGDGLSHPQEGVRVRVYRLRVAFEKANPMVVYLKAETPAKAKLYAKNRWPSSTAIEIIK